MLVSVLRASARALALSALTQRLFIVMDNAEAAQYMYSDLRSLTAGADRPATPDRGSLQTDQVFFFPSSKRRRTTDDAALIQRTECLTALTSERAEERLIVVTYPEAVAEEVPAKERLSAVSFQLTVGQEIQQSELAAQLSDLGFERVDFVFQPGQYAVRGSIVDIYSYGHDIPFRLDFFGDEIESIREFDIEGIAPESISCHYLSALRLFFVMHTSIGCLLSCGKMAGIPSTNGCISFLILHSFDK